MTRHSSRRLHDSSHDRCGGGAVSDVAAPPLFLDAAELRTLTGCREKTAQMAALRSQGVPFYVNASGRPVVVRSIVEGRAEVDVRPATWTPRAVSNNR